MGRGRPRGLPLPHPGAALRALGWGAPPSVWKRGGKKQNQNAFSGYSFLRGNREGGKVHSSLQQKGRRPGSILAGRAACFRRLAASRHRSSPCSHHSCLDFTRVHITAYQRGCVSFFFFSLPFFFFLLPCTLLNGSRENKPGSCSAGGWGEEEEGREGRAPLAELLLVGARGWSGPGSLQNTGTPRGAPRQASKPLGTQTGPQRSGRVARTGTRGGL